MNLLIVKVYKVRFQNKSSRVLPIMKEALQLAIDKRIGDWFLMEEHTIIRVDGFTHEPYI